MQLTRTQCTVLQLCFQHFIDEKSKRVLHAEVVDVREVAGKKSEHGEAGF